MAYGLLNAGADVKGQAMQGMKSTANEENQRNIANNNIEAGEKAAKKSNASAGATTGAIAGVQAASSAAAAAGMTAGTGTLIASGLATGGIGLMAGLVLSELF